MYFITNNLSFRRFVPPEPSDQVKATLRELAPMGLAYPESKIRNSIAAIISSIAHWDWPEQWPALFDTLMKMLQLEEVRSCELIQLFLNLLMDIGCKLLDNRLICREFKERCG